jgi:hypothetical protein
MPLSLPFDDDNVGNEIIYTAEPCEDVEMSYPDIDNCCF